MINARPSGVVGGDKADCTRFPDAKMSPCMKRPVNAFGRKDTLKSLNPDEIAFSRYYSTRSGDGAQ